MLETSSHQRRTAIDRRTILALAGAGLLAALSPECSQAADAQKAPEDLPPFVRRGLPGPFHEALKPLGGSWRVDKRIYIAIGTKDHPAISHQMTCKRRWFGGGRHLEDITQGGLGDGTYYRLGVLGFSTIDHRYEWATFDALNANMMIYRSARMDTPGKRILMTGVFTDQGLLGEAYAGKSIPMRTTLEILGPNRHSIDLTFMPPGEPDVLIDRSIYTRA
jgi:Protein of unknown function (DUF1579)